MSAESGKAELRKSSGPRHFNYFIRNNIFDSIGFNFKPRGQLFKKLHVLLSRIRPSILLLCRFFNQNWKHTFSDSQIWISSALAQVLKGHGDGKIKRWESRNIYYIFQCIVVFRIVFTREILRSPTKNYFCLVH